MSVIVPLVAALVVVSIAACLLVIWLSAAWRKNQVRSQSKPLEIDRANCSISERNLRSRAHAFEEGEDIVHWASRRDFFTVAPAMVLPLLMALALVAAAAYLMLRSPITLHTDKGAGPLLSSPDSHPVRHPKPASLHVPLKLIGGVLIAAAVFMMFVLWNMLLRWWADVIIVTNRNERRDFQAWAYAWWLWNDEKHIYQPLGTIVAVEPESTGLGSIPMLDYGNIRVVTRIQSGEETEEDVHILVWIPRFETCAKVLSTAKQEVEELAAAPALNMGETLEAIRKTLHERLPSADSWPTWPS